MIPHLCETSDCPYIGKPSPESCKCHQTDIARLRASHAELLGALRLMHAIRFGYTSTEDIRSAYAAAYEAITNAEKV